MALVGGIFLVLVLWLTSGVGLPSGIKGDVDLFFAIPTALYLAFIGGWAIAYCRSFRFPERQRVLLLGVVIGGLVIPLLTASYGLYHSKAVPTDLLMFLAARLFGAALQLYFLVLCLRYLFKVTP